jgi:hypothetical protein
MLPYRIIGWIVVLALATLVDWFVWRGQHWPLILGIFAIPSFEWVSRAFLALCTDQPRDPDEERLVRTLDRGAGRVRCWWRRRLVEVRSRLRGVLSISPRTDSSA